MKLNLDIIAENLSKSYHITRLGSNDFRCFYKRPFLYEKDCVFEKERIYIAPIESFKHLFVTKEIICPKDIAFVFIGDYQFDEIFTSVDIQILFIDNAPNFISVFHDIQKIFDKYDAWDCSLRDELENSNDIDLEKMLNMGTEMLENPMCVTNQNLQVLFDSYYYLKEDEQGQATTTEGKRHLSIDYSIKVKEVCKKEQKIKAPYISSIRMEYRAYCFNLYPLGYFAGCIAVSESNRAFRDSDFVIADHFFVYFQKAFLRHLRYYHPKKSTFELALRKALNKEPLNKEAQRELSPMPGECWVCFKLEEVNQEYMPKQYMASLLNALMPNIVTSILYHDTIKGIIRISESQDNKAAEVIDMFKSLLKQMNYVAGISSPFTDILQINDYVDQADYALHRVTESNCKDTIYSFQDHILEYMLSQCIKDISLPNLYPHGLQALIEYDKKKQSDYVKTLDIYLQNEMNATKTAEALYLHRSSVLKRLKKIENQFGIDLSDSNTRLHLLICLKLLKISNN